VMRESTTGLPVRGNRRGRSSGKPRLVSQLPG
jgi:hypothetical protein